MAYPRDALLRGSFSPCHPVIYELEPVKNTHKISIFLLFSGSSSQATR
ncbi:hypothetical protein RBEAN4_1030 [Rickettsia bellii str. RML An4]|uniref:RPE4 domain protein n=1 Tax=Rickettsia bellii str. RML An4 TaxID=1359193 RepID=A0A0F3QBU8_RICBE|nr:hypothetical protein RBEAN4_1030 [Rickettsia bellii str. RML An4]